MLVVTASFAAACGDGVATRQARISDRVDFNFDVKPILSDRCYHCHGPDEAVRESELRLDTEEGAFHELAGEPGAFAIVPGDLEASVLYRRITSDDPNERMPPPESNRTLDEREIAVLGRWIEQGAEWRRHWSFIPLRRPEVPEADSDAAADHGPVGNAIDAFVRTRLDREGLAPSPEADRPTLLRRVTFDLTGLPPSLEELDDFLADESTDAYERVVDRLLASPAYGEKMALHWLDAARYADSHGYQDDVERSIWPWRDWVIHAFNQNLPYDEFGRWQLAGDLLPDATLEQRLATGFNRNHMITQEGGAIDEEFRTAYVADRVSTTATVFLGLTFECARCHDHKFDPISQSDYYGFFGFFNNVPEKGLIDYVTLAPEPAIHMPYEEARAALPFIGPFDGDTLRSMIMADMDTIVRPIHVLDRGRYDHPRGSVEVGTPAAILPFGDRPPDRGGLADWLFDPANPLPARVAANRFWSIFFGRGIVPTIDDFGSQGAIPSHPELLDWLATTFVESGWDTKALLRTIVLSATYRRSSDAPPEVLDRDPDNVLLARGPRFRLSGEALRDQVLAASGLLVHDVGGPSVKPYQPAGIWEEKTGGGGGSLATYVADSGNKLYRRSLYTFWKRTVPPPSMMAFDAPDRSLAAVHRATTSTPLQSLVLMNDPQWTEAARALAYRLLEDGSGAEGRIERAFRLLTARSPTLEESSELLALLEDERARYSAAPGQADDLLSVGAVEHPEGVDRTEAAAYTMVVSAIFNLYETITRS